MTTMNEDFSLGKRIEELREMRKMKLIDLSEKINITTVSIAKIKKRNDTKLSYVKLMAKAFDVSLVEFFGGQVIEPEYSVVSEQDLTVLYQKRTDCQEKLNAADKKIFQLQEELINTKTQLIEAREKLHGHGQ